MLPFRHIKPVRQKESDRTPSLERFALEGVARVVKRLAEVFHLTPIFLPTKRIRTPPKQQVGRHVHTQIMQQRL